MGANSNFTSVPYYCDSYGIKRKPTSVKNPQANAILEHIHAVVMNMLRTAGIDTADSVKPSDMDIFLSDAAWAICSTHHMVLESLTRCSNIWMRHAL